MGVSEKKLFWIKAENCLRLFAGFIALQKW